MAGATIKDIVQAVRRRPGVQQSEELVPVIEHNIPDRCQALALELASDPLLRQYIQRPDATPYVVTFVLGVADLSTLTDILVESIPQATLLHTDTVNYPIPFDHKPRRADLLDSWKSPDGVLYTIEGQRLLARDVDGRLGQLAGDVNIFGACFVPVVTVDGAATTLPDRFKSDLVRLLAELLGAPDMPEHAEAAASEE